MARVVFVVLAFLLGTGCVPAPYASDFPTVVARLARHYDLVFPDAVRGLEVGVLRPRFGIPAITTDRSFTLQVLERGARGDIEAFLVRGDLSAAELSACRTRPGADCTRLALAEQPTHDVDGTHRVRSFTARTDESVALRGYDLVVTTARGQERLPRAVFLRDAAASSDLTVVLLSDPHIGRWGQRDSVVERLDRAVSAINAIGPDVVVVTGDVAEDGKRRALELTARNALQRIDAPVLVVLGNHDHGHWPQVRHASEPDEGYYRFAGTFHGLPLYGTTLGGWDLVGLDTGPAVYSPRVLVRGIAPALQARIDDALGEAARAGRNVVLFSHGPTRAALGSDPHKQGSHRLGSMAMGGERLERSMLEAAGRGQQVLHLAGHTHWSDAFVARPDRAGFVRVPFAQLPCEVSLETGAALITAPSVTRISFPTVRHGNAFGMVLLRLGKTSSTARFLLVDQKERPLGCSR